MSKHFILIQARDGLYYYISNLYIKKIREMCRTMGTFIQESDIFVMDIDSNNRTLEDIYTSLSNSGDHKLILIKIKLDANPYILLGKLVEFGFEEMIVISGTITGV